MTKFCNINNLYLFTLTNSALVIEFTSCEFRYQENHSSQLR